MLVEAVIVELSENAANDLGVEAVFSGGSENGEIPIGITRFNDSGPDLLSIVGGAADDTNSFNHQFNNFTIKYTRYCGWFW